MRLAPGRRRRRASSRPRRSSWRRPCSTGSSPSRRALGGFTDHDVDRSEAPGGRAQGGARRRSRRTTSGTASRAPSRRRRRSPTRRARRRRRRATRWCPFDGTPAFEQHKVLVGAGDGRRRRGGDVRRARGHGGGHGEARRLRALQPGGPGAERVRARRRARPREPPRAGESTRRRRCASSRAPRAAMVALDVRTRQILALVGSYEGQAGALDRATQSRRQPGSTFKPIVYSYALHSRRFTPATLVDPTPGRLRGRLPAEQLRGLAGPRSLCACARRSPTA